MELIFCSSQRKTLPPSKHHHHHCCYSPALLGQLQQVHSSIESLEGRLTAGQAQLSIAHWTLSSKGGHLEPQAYQLEHGGSQHKEQKAVSIELIIIWKASMQEDHSVSLINMQAVCLPSYFVLQQLHKLCEVLTVVMHNIVLSCNKQTNNPPKKTTTKTK